MFLVFLAEMASAGVPLASFLSRVNLNTELSLSRGQSNFPVPGWQLSAASQKCISSINMIALAVPALLKHS